MRPKPILLQLKAPEPLRRRRAPVAAPLDRLLGRGEMREPHHLGAQALLLAVELADLDPGFRFGTKHAPEKKKPADEQRR